MAKVSNFMYGMIVAIGLFSILALGFFPQLFINYNVPLTSGYNKTFTTLSNYSGLNKYVETQKQNTLAETGTQKTNIIGQAFDVLGYWFERGYGALKATKDVIGLFSTIVEVSLDSLSQYLGIAVGPLKFIIISCVVVAIVIGVILSTLVKREV